MNERATNAFLLHTEHARQFAKAILQHLEDQKSVDPRELTWSQRSEIVETANKLERIANELGVKLEGE